MLRTTRRLSPLAQLEFWRVKLHLVTSSSPSQAAQITLPPAIGLFSVLSTAMKSSGPSLPGSSGAHGDITLFITTPASHDSDGPTLPILGSTGENTAANKTAGKSRTSGENATKKRKMNDGTPVNTTPSTAPRADLAPLYQPWTLLPPEVRIAVEKRLANNCFWEENCVPVVFTKNQNVRSGINKLKALLGFEGAAEGSATIMGNESAMVAISAQGEATTKLVGIVEMTKRIVGSGGETSGEVWYMYTILASRTITKTPKVQEKEQSNLQTTPEDDGFEPIEKSTDIHGSEGKVMKVPVLTVWMCRKSIPEFSKPFGEQTFNVGTKGKG